MPVHRIRHIVCLVAMSMLVLGMSVRIRAGGEGSFQGMDPGEHERNEQWFYQQRAYPFGEIPPDARRVAWERWRQISAARRTATSAKTIHVPPRAASLQRWTPIGPAPTLAAIRTISPVSGRVFAIAVSPADPNLVLLGGTSGGIWRSTDAGVTFVPVSDDQVDLAVGSIAFAQSSPSIVYAAMGEEYLSSGVLKSTDAGATWNRVNDSSLTSPGLSLDIEVSPTDPRRVYLAQYAGLDDEGDLRSSGVFVSADGGVHWSMTLHGLARDIAVDPANPSTVCATMQRIDDGSGRPPGVFRSTDSGQTWANTFTGPFDPARGPTFNVAISPAEPSRVMVYGSGIFSNQYQSRIAASTDSGKTFTIIGGSGLPSGTVEFLEVSPLDAMKAFVGYAGGDVFRTLDGGASWYCVTRGYCDGVFGAGDKTHVDMHSFAFSPVDAGRVYLGGDGGLYSSGDSGTEWEPRNQSLSLTTFRSIAIHPLIPGLSFGGTQDNGTQRRQAGTSGWQEIITGDGGQIVIDPVDPSIMFTTYIYGTIFIWGDNGQSYNGVVAENSSFDEPNQYPRIAFYPPFVGSATTERLFFGTWRLFVSDSLGSHWTAPGGTLDLTRGDYDVLSAIGVAPSDQDVIYTGSSRGRVMRSSDGGDTWKDVTRGLPDRFVTGITVDRRNPAVAWLTVSGFRSGHVYKTMNFGSTWMDVSGELPDIPANAMLQDPIDPNVMYLATDIGVFRNSGGGDVWESLNDGMPPAVVLGLASHPSGLIQAATYGRGAYELGDSTEPPVDYALSLAEQEVTIQRGQKAPVTVLVDRNAGFAERVDVTAPDGRSLKLKFTPSSASTTGSSVSFDLKVKKKARPGTYTLQFAGQSQSGVLRTATLTLTVT